MIDLLVSIIPVISTLTLAAEVLSAVMVAVSILWPRRRVWPSNPQHPWGQPVMLGLFILSGVGAAVTGVLDWGSLGLPGWLRMGVGVPLAAGGMAQALWAMITLGAASTAGAAGGLVHRGPYRWSRNPQYVGFILALAGWALLTASKLAVVTALAGILPLALAPFAEEPWLMAQYGAAYHETVRRTPRFLIW